MTGMRRFVLRILNTIRPSRMEPDLARELASHVSLLEDEFQRRGMTQEAAHRAARLALGGVEQTKERHRHARSFAWIDDLRRDVRYAARTLARAPGFTAVAVITLALGIGANTAVFSITHAVLLRPLPYREPDRLVAVWDRIVREQGMSKLFVQYRDLERWQELSRSFEQLAAVTWATAGRILTGHGAPRNVLAIPATRDLFSLLGVPPRLGRTFEPEDQTRGCTLVLSHRFWRDVLGGPTNLSTLALSLDDEACTVAGVMPAGFVFFPEPTAMWRLITPNDILVRNPERTGGVGVFGRLKAGVTLAAAETELKLLSRQIDRGLRYGTEMEPRVYPLQQEFTFLAGRNLRLGVIVLFGAVTFVLLIACANVANLVLRRSLARQRELAIRAALGSGRGRLIRQLLTESLALSFGATALGTLMATAAVTVFRWTNPIEMPAGVRAEMSLPVLAFTTILAMVTTVLFGLLPAWRVSRVDVQTALKAGGHGGHDRRRYRLAKALIVAEISLSLVLLVGAALLVESVLRFASAPLGFEPRGLMTMPFGLPSKHYATSEQRMAFFERALNHLGVLPDVQSCALSTVLPLRSGRGSHVLSVEGRPDPSLGNAVHDIGAQSVTPDYFAIMNIRRVRGRGFETDDREGATPVAVVNETLARRYFAGEDPIGRRIRFDNEPAAANPWLTIVGMVADEKRTTPYDEMSWADAPVVYQPLAQKAVVNDVYLLFRSRTGRREIGAAVQEQIARVDPAVVVGQVETAQHLIDRYIAHPRFRAALLGSFAALALLLAAVGLYAILSQLVAQRTHEIGVRMALGARTAEVMRLVLGQSALLTATGIALGLAGAAAVTQFLSTMLFGVTPLDRWTFAAASALFAAVAALASVVPVRHATEVDPLVAIRSE
jgi:putative ABC transport system permease protein